MNVKKTAAAVMAAAVLAVAAPIIGLPDPTGIVASAAEQELLVADVNTVFGNGVGNSDWKSLGGGYFFVKPTGTIYKIGESELDNWRKTGKLTPTVVKNNTGISFSGVDLFDRPGYSYFSFMETDLEDGFHNFFHVCALDKEKNTIELLFTTKSWSTDEKFTGTTVSVNEVTSNGIAKLEKRSYSDGKELELWYEWIDLSNNNKVIYTWKNNNDPMLKTWFSDKFAGYYISYKDEEAYLCGLLKNGDTEVLERSEWYNAFEFVYAFNGGLIYGLKRYNEEYTLNGALIVEGMDFFVYLESTGKHYRIDPAIGDYIRFDPDRLRASVNGNRIMLDAYQKEAMAELKDDGCKILIDQYDSISSLDGEIYLVRNYGKKVEAGYVDKTGKELSMGFKDATEFNGDYAAVRKDGKSYLIDRNMNTVSEKVDAAYMWEMGENLFLFYDYASSSGDNNERFVTLAAKSTGKPAAPAAPTKPTSSKPSTNSVTLTWDKVSGATGYVIKYSLDGGKTWTTKTVSGNSITLTDLTPGIAYTYRIAAKNGDTEGAYTSDFTFKTEAAVSGAPTNVTNSKPGTNSVTLTWDKVSGATGYVIKYSLDGGKTWITKTVSGNSITLTDLTPGTTYTYRIAAKNGDTEGAYTSDFTFKTADKPDETSNPVSEPTSDPVSEPDNTSDSDKVPPTGFAGAMTLLGAAVTAGAFVVVSKKKR